MSIPDAPVRLFRKALLLWTLGFACSGWFGFEACNTMALSPVWLPPGPLKYVTHALAMAPGGYGSMATMVAVALLVLLCLYDLFSGPRTWTSALIWFMYLNLMNKAWLAGSGGQQLVANLLFWNIFLAAPASTVGPLRTWLHGSAFWIVRLQLLLAYAATGLHKLTGTHWIDGTAMGIVATDPAFGPRWIAEAPWLAMGLTWAVLLFQLTFPIAVWFRRTRIPWMLFGVIFHLGTAIWMDIPEMGLAFIAAYTIWLNEGEAARILRAIGRVRGGRRSA